MITYLKKLWYSRYYDCHLQAVIDLLHANGYQDAAAYLTGMKSLWR